MPRRLLQFLCVVLLCATTLPAQAPQPERRTIAVSVLDRDGHTVPGLTTANFRGEFRGQPVKVLSSASDTRPRQIAVVIDRSGSTKERKILEAAWMAAEDAAFRLANPHSVAVYTFADFVQRHIQFTPNAPALQTMFTQVAAGIRIAGSTALYDAITEVADEFRPGSFADVLFLVSDCGDNASQTTDKQAELTMKRNDLRAFVVLLPWRDEPRKGRRAKGFARRLADNTGGLILEVNTDKPKEIQSHLSLLYAAITNVYVLEVEIPVLVDRPRDWKLEVVDANGQELKGATVAYPKLLIPVSARPLNR